MAGMKQFGKREEAAYIDRPGAYGVILGANGKIGVVDTPVGFYLVGGGIDKDEDPEVALTRECLEEIGYEATVIQKIGVAAQYVYSKVEDKYFNKIGNFYLIRLGKIVGGAQEADHRLEWLEKNEAIKRMAHEFLSWAIAEANIPD
jgi:8-oxo-dGTP diphosphatase